MGPEGQAIFKKYGYRNPSSTIAKNTNKEEDVAD
jgi:hypothetical protein